MSGGEKGDLQRGRKLGGANFRISGLGRFVSWRGKERESWENPKEGSIKSIKRNLKRGGRGRRRKRYLFSRVKGIKWAEMVTLRFGIK